ncbi:MAG: DUF4340 domain-containing protein [Leptospiraceae bacterium]|nr:DUF4340 domain-containing protein [Leptospiraceae bacterium]
MKKVFLILAAFVFLGFVFFFSEERFEDGLTEVKYWIINPEEIRYLPPKNSSEFSKFISSNLNFQKKETGLKTSPLFTIKGIDSDSKEEYLYEGNYNVKNLFTELSVISTKSITAANPDLLNKFEISIEKSPSIEILKSSKLQKKIYLGEETRDNSRRYLLSDKDLITASSHIFQKLTNSSLDFRERNYTRFSEFDLVRMVIQGEGIRLNVENNPETKNGIQTSKWFKILNGKYRINPSDSANLYPYLQSFKVEIYPDDSNGEGFAVARELTKTETLVQVDIFLINGLHYKIKLFPKVVLKNKSYYPVVKEVENFFIESPTYTSEELVVKLISLLKKIQSDPEWTEPKGK